MGMRNQEAERSEVPSRVTRPVQFEVEQAEPPPIQVGSIVSRHSRERFQGLARLAALPQPIALKHPRLHLPVHGLTRIALGTCDLQRLGQQAEQPLVVIPALAIRRVGAEIQRQPRRLTRRPAECQQRVEAFGWHRYAGRVSQIEASNT